MRSHSILQHEGNRTIRCWKCKKCKNSRSDVESREQQNSFWKLKRQKSVWSWNINSYFSFKDFSLNLCQKLTPLIGPEFAISMYLKCTWKFRVESGFSSYFFDKNYLSGYQSIIKHMRSFHSYNPDLMKTISNEWTMKSIEILLWALSNLYKVWNTYLFKLTGAIGTITIVINVYIVRESSICLCRVESKVDQPRICSAVL